MIAKASLFACAALLLAACQPSANAVTNAATTNAALVNGDPPPAAPTNAAAPAPTPAGPVINAEGFGPLRVGMTWEEALAAMPSLTRQLEEQMEACYTAQSTQYPGLSVMFEDRRLARVSAWDPSQVTDAQGLHVGQPAAAVRAAYGDRLLQEPHHYEDPPAVYLTLWTTRGQRGVRYEIGGNGNISAIHGGGPQIEYIEGCA
jgi:hypothetical protein